MTPTERAAFDAGIRHAASMAQVAAVTIETSPGRRDVRQRAAVAALQGLADALKIEAAVIGETKA